ncbi:MAG: redoxin domain-containing protein [Armatimonadetes bacterium]|nr:redoxin domain-containing protein [Armatimonadota bacterium]
MLRNATPAPDFTLPDSEGQTCSLAGLRSGGPLLLAFFRGAFCPTAQRDLMNLANVAGRIVSLGAHVAAVSTTPPEEARQMRQALGLPFPILTDADFAVSERYGVYRSDETEGTQPHGEPATFILDVDGRIAYSQIQTGPKGTADPNALALVLLYMSQHGGRY